jgi:ferric-dicitrate binding protein FerR (iron transport regulator)
MKTEDIKITPKWRKSKDEIWNEVFADLDIEKNSAKVKHLSFWKYAAAAAIAMMIAGASFAYLYTATETAVRGAHLTVTLPDGSTVNLNADSELKYKPCLWFASRNVELVGEACFDVKPAGKQFTVKSSQNQVKVLGTSFNVFARAEKYSVTCLTGKVEVTANNEPVILTPNMQATLRNDKLEVSENVDTEQSIGWTQNKFIFMGVPLTDVVKEIERQYNIRVTTTSKLDDHFFGGNFAKPNNPEEALQIIGKPFGITFKIQL